MKNVRCEKCAWISKTPVSPERFVNTIEVPLFSQLLELLQIIHHQTAKEGLTVFQRRLIDDHSGSLGLDPLHDPLDRAVAEIVRPGLHHQPVDADRARTPRDDLILGIVSDIMPWS